MSEKPMLFSAPMVRALLAGAKTQTRRALKPQPYDFVTDGKRYWNASGVVGGRICISDRDLLDLHNKPNPGDRLWVRETFSYEALDVDRDRFMEPWYWADGNPPSGDFTKPKPSIHMPRLYSRFTLIVESVKVERLQDISEADARAEGVFVPEAQYAQQGPRAPILAYAALWESINGDGSWAANPWVMAVTFRVIRQNINAIAPQPER